MRCLSCHYELKNLPENRCPECGREFDPSDPKTFAVELNSASDWKQALLSIAIAFLLVAGAFAVYLVYMIVRYDGVLLRD